MSWRVKVVSEIETEGGAREGKRGDISNAQLGEQSMDSDKQCKVCYEDCEKCGRACERCEECEEYEKYDEK